MFLSGLLIGGLKYPMVSAGLGAAWCVARVMYTLGYTSDKPDGSGRRIGTWALLPEMGESENTKVLVEVRENADGLFRTPGLRWIDRMESAERPVAEELDGVVDSQM